MSNQIHTETCINSQMKYKQTDITSYFGVVKMKKYNKRKHSNKTTLIEDSDGSDFEPHRVVTTNKTRKKLKLPYPLSGDESAVDENSIDAQVKTGRPKMLVRKQKKSCKNKKILPAATSTPLKSNIPKENNQSTHRFSKNSSEFSNFSTILNQSSSSNCSHPKILQNVVISPKDKNEATTSTSPKTNEQDDNDETLQNISNNTSTSSSDTIILNKSATSFLNVEKVLPNPVLSVGDKSLNKKQTSESVEELPQSHSVLEGHLNMKLKISLSVDPEIQQKNIGTGLNIMHQTSNLNLLTEKSKGTSNIIKLSPSTCGKTKSSTRKSSTVKASKNLLVSSTSPRSPTSKDNSFKTPLKGTANQVTSKTLFSSAEPSLSTFQSKTNGLQLKPEEEDEKLNFKHLDCIKELFKNSLNDDDEKQLLLATDKEIIKEFLEMNVHYQYLLMKLFLYVPKWYNIIKLCTKIKLDQKISVNEVTKMYTYLKDHKFVDSDIKCLELDVLLDMLLVVDLKRICAKFRLGNRSNKKDIIENLKKNCRTQSTLFTKKSTEDLLKDAVVDKLGYCVKLREDIRKSFYKAYLLQTFTNPLYLDPQKYLSDMNYLNITYPDYTIERYNPFAYREQFSSFYEALILKKAYFDASDKKKVVIMKNICDLAFERLRNLKNEGKYSRYLSVYLQRFSAEYQYISLLKTAAKRLITYNESVKTWLQFLLENYPSHHALGFWYKQLAHILVKYEKDYESAAKVVMEAFELNKKQNIFNLVELYDLNLLATKIRTTKSYKVDILFCDKLAALSERTIEYENFPKIIIAGQTDRSGKCGRRTYSFLDENGEENYGNVEMIVLKYYEKEENWEGIHCEGRLIANLFTLFFWDIIYCYYVPNTFISKFQNAPLDMYTDFFYKNRKIEIDERMQDIAQNWSSEKIEKFLKENWDYHSQEETITNFNSVTTSFQELLRMVKCIDRKVLSDIFKRLVINFKIFHSGLPDLFLWNSDSNKCKFVEVKGEGDKLSHKQILWIQYLIDIGANAEMCHVSGVGSRKLKIGEVDD
ncbi:hypothetical protein WA026_015117 [Henosepilachna vigintioctopunctata]|uniref:Fanconi-associated nuclease n=1 Tax=Henosepilachna vigintioctopunctata TaxID=420089 RepID=A0AAW1TNG8_9CUCU